MSFHATPRHSSWFRKLTALLTQGEPSSSQRSRAGRRPLRLEQLEVRSLLS